MYRYSMYIIKQSPLFVNIFWKLFLLLWLYFIYPLCYNQFAVFLLQLKGGVHQCICSHHFYYLLQQVQLLTISASGWTDRARQPTYRKIPRRGNFGGFVLHNSAVTSFLPNHIISYAFGYFKYMQKIFLNANYLLSSLKVVLLIFPLIVFGNSSTISRC